jgi:hypothetical protein
MKTIITSFSLLLISCAAIAQENDLGMWSTLNLNYSFNKKVMAFYTQEFRLKQNFTRINLFYSEFGLQYKKSKNFKAALSYRNIQKAYDDGFYGLKHRIQLDFTFKKKANNVGISYRSRFQGEVGYPGADEFGINFIKEFYWRHKFDLKFELSDSKLTPYTGTELRFMLSNPRVDEIQGFNFDRTRLYAGTEIAINNRHTLDFYYLLQFDFQTNNPITLSILGVAYTIQLGYAGSGGKGKGEE